MTNRPLRVWVGNYNGDKRRIAAARSPTEAMRLFGVGKRYFRDYFRDSDNEVEIQLAKSEPGVVFESEDNFHSDKVWTRVKL
jgi:hypothetical protein